MSQTTFLNGIYEVMDCYDGFIIDQWGVLHNGIQPYDGVLDTLKRLKQHNKQVIILSNSAKRADYNVERMAKVGIKSSMYSDVISSGEVTWRGLKDRKDTPFKDVGNKCYLISKDDDLSLIEGVDLELVKDIEKANFILLTGFGGKIKNLDEMEDDFKRAVAKHVHMICANPDMVTVYGNERGIGPGAIAKKYQDLGGAVHYIGKPYKTIFRSALSMFNKVIPSRVLVIGDSIYHDIAGATAVDLDSAFVASGVHAKEFSPASSVEDKLKSVDRICRNYGGVYPKYFMDSLIWQTPEAAKRDRERERMTD